jgi:hypothetical protein
MIQDEIFLEEHQLKLLWALGALHESCSALEKFRVLAVLEPGSN